MNTYARIDKAIREATRPDPTAEVDLDTSGGYNSHAGFDINYYDYRIRRGLTFKPVFRVRVTESRGSYTFSIGDGYERIDGLDCPSSSRGWLPDELDQPMNVITSAIKEALNV